MANWFTRIFSFRNAVVFVHPAKPPQASPATELPAVVRAVQLLSVDVARLPKYVVNSKGERVDHWLADMLNGETSRFQSGFDLLRYSTAQALQDGNAYVIVRRADDGQVAELVPTPRGMCVPEWSDDGPLYRFAGGNTLDSSQVIHIGCYPDPMNPAWYIAPLDAAPSAGDIAAEEDAAHLDLVRTGSTGKISISHKGGLADAVVEAIRSAWRDLHSKAGNGSLPLVLREGMVANKLGPETTSTLGESRRFSVRQVGRAFGVPPEMLYEAGGGALPSQAETTRAYVDGGLALWTTAWSRELTRKILAGTGLTLRIDVKPLLRGTLKDQGMALSKLVLAQVLTPNEAREVVDLPPIEGGHKLSAVMPGAALGALGPDAADAQESGGQGGGR